MVEEMTAHLQGLVKSYDKEGKPDEWVRQPTKQEWDYINNERLLSRFDFKYWALRYCHINLSSIDGRDSGVNRLGTVGFMRPQVVFLEKISKTQERMYDQLDRGMPVDGIRYFINKGRQLHFCLAAGAKILTADMQWIPIERAAAGQELLSVDENVPGAGKSRRMRKATIDRMLTMSAPAVRVAMDDGTSFIATSNHKFLCKWGAKSQVIWKTVGSLHVGDKIRRLCPFEPEGTEIEDAWFGGLLDGEGSLSRTKGSMRITVSQASGPVLDRARKYLSDRGYKFSERIDTRKPGTSSKFGSKPVHTLVVMRADEIIRLLVKTRPVRWSHAWWDNIELPRCTSLGKWSTVSSIEDAGVQTVYDLETSTHTFVVNGLVTHNTALCRMISNHRTFFWPDTQAIGASVNDDMVHELYYRDKVMYDNLPWFLKPEIGFDVKDQQLSFKALGTETLYHQANQHGAMGSGRSIKVAHMTECALWDDMVSPGTLQSKLDNQLFPAIPQDVQTIYLLESSSNGLGGWWYDQIQLILHLKSLFELFFCPWYAANKKHRREPPEGWEPGEYVTEVAGRVKRTSSAYLGFTVELDKQQMYWYESTMKQHERRLAEFFTNYPSTLDESFQAFGDHAFSVELLAELKRGVGTLHGAYDLVTAT